MSAIISGNYDLGITKIIIGGFFISMWIIFEVVYNIKDGEWGWASYITLGIGIINLSYGLYRFISGGQRVDL